jgi:hypothetical protein
MARIQENDASNFGVASGLAKLLATENIRVEFRPGVPTAYFDIKNRVLVSPVWKGISLELRDMLLVHETGHALDTPYDPWKKAIKELSQKHHKDKTTALKAEQTIQHFLNVVEDPRIDKRQKRRFPGAKRDYVVGLGELHDRDFFGLKAGGKDINTLGFPDRLNIYFKGGMQMGIKFNKKELEFVDRVEKAETFADVVKITDDLYAYARSQGQYDMATQKGGTLILEDAEDGEEGDGDGDEIDLDQFDEVIDNRTKSGKGGQGKNGKPSKGEGEDGDEDGEGEGKDKKGKASKGSKDAEAKAEEGISPDRYAKPGQEKKLGPPQPSTQKAPAGQGSGGGGVPDDFIPAVYTETAAQKNMEKFVLDVDANYIYLTTPEFDLTKCVDDFRTVIPEMIKSKGMADHDQHSSARKEAAHLAKLTQWRKDENDTISFMVREFEMRKAADAHARIQIAKTGVLDTNKLHGYKYNDDIFRRVATIPDGKNHGFVMILDWSGSMQQDLQYTMKQLFSLTLFCKRVGIPFEVYLFKTGTGRQNSQKNTGPNSITFGPFILRNVLSSRMNQMMFNNAMNILWHQTVWHSGSDHMNSTPLNQSILALHEIVNKFQKKNNVQIASTIIITDGASDTAMSITNEQGLPAKKGGNKYFLRDHITGHVYPLSGDPRMMYGAFTTVMCKILKQRTNSNLVGFHLTQSDNMMHTGCAGEVDNNFLKSQEAKTCWDTNKFLSIKTAGYDEYFIMQVRKDKTPDLMKVNARMDKEEAAKAFMTFNRKKLVNRVLLSRFVTMIANLHKKPKAA